MKERLQKILARSGHGSRRAAELLITDGRVQVNGEVVTALGTQADIDVDRIEVDGVLVEVPSTTELVYLAMNKPSRFLTTLNDPHGRRTVMELLPPGLPHHVIPVGRLDRDTEGLLIFSNDGEFAHRMAHPRYQIEKEYFALVTGEPSEETLRRLRTGVSIDGKRTSPADADIVPHLAGFANRDQHAWLRIVIHEGRRRQVRLMCAAVGHPVRTLVRNRVGSIELARLTSGTVRILSDREVSQLKALLGLASSS